VRSRTDWQLRVPLADNEALASLGIPKEFDSASAGSVFNHQVKYK
jgi:hypothetical protein